jgi:hypothetical protein
LRSGPTRRKAVNRKTDNSAFELKIDQLAEDRLRKNFRKKMKKLKLRIKILNFVKKVLDIIL